MGGQALLNRVSTPFPSNPSVFAESLLVPSPDLITFFMVLSKEDHNYIRHGPSSYQVPLHLACSSGRFDTMVLIVEKM
jgi:hypothetical protein